jgi:hypothetical protein
MEQIKIGYDKSTGLYVIPNQNYSIINGKKDKIDIIYYNNSKVLITSIKPETYQTYNNKIIITHYIKDNDVEVGTLFSEDYNNQKYNLETKGYYNDYEWFFDELEDEIKYKRFLKDWKPITKQEEIIIDYEIIFIEVPISEYEDIQPLASMEDINSCEKAMFIYKPNPKKYFTEYCESLGMVFEPNDYKKTPNSYSFSSSGFEYVKINGDYLFLGDNKPRMFQKTSKYQECINRMNQDIKFIKDSVDLFLRKNDKISLTNIERGSYYKNLINIKNSIKELEVHKKHHSNQSSLINKIQKLIESAKIE